MQVPLRYKVLMNWHDVYPGQYIFIVKKTHKFDENEMSQGEPEVGSDRKTSVK